VLERMEKWMYRSANHVVAVGNGYRDNIVSKAPVADRISVITNGVDAELFKPRDSSASFRQQLGVTRPFVCAYVGTIGMAHGLEVVIEAAKRLKQLNRDDIQFLLVGDGARRAHLEQLAVVFGVEDLVLFAGRLDKSSMPDVLASSDCLLVHLKGSELFETVIPSKIFEAMAMQRPLIMGVRGESAEIVRLSQSGLFMEPDNAAELVQCVQQLADDQLLYQRLCQSGRRFVVENYSRDQLAARFLDIIFQVAGRSR
jgi:glycosyltransferase involved in cell wall biosynthesis